jgi:hypothetical protein
MVLSRNPKMDRIKMQTQLKEFRHCPTSFSRRDGCSPTTTGFETGILFHFGFQSANINVNQRQDNGYGFLFLVCL